MGRRRRSRAIAGREHTHTKLHCNDPAIQWANLMGNDWPGQPGAALVGLVFNRQCNRLFGAQREPDIVPLLSATPAFAAPWANKQTNKRASAADSLALCITTKWRLAGSRRRRRISGQRAQSRRSNDLSLRLC